jgi:hypothetical protein
MKCCFLRENCKNLWKCFSFCKKFCIFNVVYWGIMTVEEQQKLLQSQHLRAMRYFDNAKKVLSNSSINLIKPSAGGAL